MHTRNRTLIALALLVALGGTTGAWGQAFGRVVVFVTDVDGNPIADAQITVTHEELPDFLIETKTKKKGKATIAFADATKFYQMTVEKEGFDPDRSVVKAELRDTIEKQVVLREKGQEVQLPSGEVATRRFSPSEKLFNQGVEFLQAGDIESAKAKFTEAITENGELAPAHSALAAVYLEEKSYNEAIASANTFLALSPDHPSGYRVLYEAYRGLGQDAEAEESLAKLQALGDSGDSAILLYNEGVEALRIKNNDVARERFEAALEADPQLAPALVAIGRIDIEQENFEAAANRAEQAIAIDPTNYTANLVRYEAYRGLGDQAKSDEAFAGLAAADPKRVASLFYDKGIELFNAGNAGAAADSFKRALEANPELVKAHYHLGIASVNTGASETARQHLQKFLELAPDDPDAATASEMLKYLGN